MHLSGLHASRAEDGSPEKGELQRKDLLSPRVVELQHRGITTFCFHSFGSVTLRQFTIESGPPILVLTQRLIMKFVPILSSGSGLADDTVESMVGILGTMCGT